MNLKNLSNKPLTRLNLPEGEKKLGFWERKQKNFLRLIFALLVSTIVSCIHGFLFLETFILSLSLVVFFYTYSSQRASVLSKIKVLRE